MPDLPIPDGQALVAQAALRLLQEPALEAKVRHKVELLGHELFGTGLYQQLGNGPDKRIRYELKTQIEEQTVTLQQFCGDRFAFIRKDMPYGRKRVTRISLWQLRDAVRAKEAEGNAVAATSAWLMLGGLTRMIEELNRSYQFGPPQPAQLGQLPVWVVTGEARPQFRTTLDIPAAGASQFPTHVTLTLGRDNILPLFPYRVEYVKQQGGDSVPLMTMELYEVRRRSDLDPRSFEYNPGDQELEDVTRTVLARLGL